MKEKLKSYDFWVSVASAVMVLLQTISIKIDVPYVNEITMAFLSLLAVTGILKKNSAKTVASQTAEEDGEAVQETQQSAQDNADGEQKPSCEDGGDGQDAESKSDCDTSL